MIEFTDTMNRGLVAFKPLKATRVGMYTCGPTVYDLAHIGNFRTFLFEDLLKRLLLHRGYSVYHVRNITDIDDKTIKRSREEGVPIAELTQRYTRRFFEDMETLNCLPADVYPRATKHIDQMLDLVRRIENNGHTYVSRGSVYFRISSFPDYGKLSHVNLEGNVDGARIDSDEYEKESARDFVLWKAAKEGEPSWPSPWGEGRPGWHLECSAMSLAYLGEVFDIHSGGIDLVFPHHENEIAQSTGATGRNPVRYWLHAEHLLVDGEKMSKSKGNFYTLRDLLDGGVDPMALRYLLLSVSYRKQLNFTFGGLTAAAASLSRLKDFWRRVNSTPGAVESNPDQTKIFTDYRASFLAALCSDLNSSAALASLFEALREANSLMDAGALSESDKAAIMEILSDFKAVFGIPLENSDLLDEAVEELIASRDKARARRDFAEADRIRNELRAAGILLEDTPDGVRWKRG